MLLRFAAISVAAAACAEPVVDMELHMPANVDTFDTSCVSGVGVFVPGANIARDLSDYTGSCQEISAQDRLTGIHDEIRGKFSIHMPESGMSGIEIFGWSGPTPCQPGEFMTPDLIFHASAPYIGQDTIDLKLETTLDCAKQNVKVRPIDLFTLVSGATPSSASCATAVIADGKGYGALGQIMERDFGTGVDFYGGLHSANVTGGVAAFTASTTGLSRSCLAYDTAGEVGEGTGCTTPGGKVCAGADEVEAPFIKGDIVNEATTLDDALFTKWDTMVFVSVWNNQTPRKPIAGATIDVAATDGQVVYIDPPAAGSNTLTKRTDSVTGTSGLAVVYTNKLATIKVNAGGATREIVVGAPDFSPGAALVVMP